MSDHPDLTFASLVLMAGGKLAVTIEVDRAEALALEQHIAKHRIMVAAGITVPRPGDALLERLYAAITEAVVVSPTVEEA